MVSSRRWFVDLGSCPCPHSKLDESGSGPGKKVGNRTRVSQVCGKWEMTSRVVSGER